MAEEWKPIKPLRYTIAAKTVADLHKVDLTTVKPTGEGWEITYDDVMKVVNAKEKPVKEASKSNA